MRFSNTIEIRRSAHDVFTFLADFSKIPQWNYAIENTQPSPGPVGVGTTIRQTRTIPSRSEETLEVVEFIPDQRIALRGTLGPFDGLMLYEIAEGESGTRLTNSADLQARGLAAIAAPLAAGRVRGAVSKNLDVLKQILEAG